MAEHSKALSFYEKAVKIYEESLSPNYSSLAIPYNNIGGVYDNMDEYLGSRSRKIIRSQIDFKVTSTVFN
jgi:hypothetical protein